MSADNWLFIEKVKTNKYKLCERAADGDHDFDVEYFKTLEAAVRAANRRMSQEWPDGEYEYGVQFGNI